ARRGQRFNLVRAAVSQKVAMEITGHLTPSVFERYNITDDRPEGGREEARGCRAVWTQRCTQQGAPPEDLPLLWACYVNRPGRNRTCNPRFWSAVPATPALQRLLIFNDLAPSPQRPRCWTTPALALILALR